MQKSLTVVLRNAENGEMRQRELNEKIKLVTAEHCDHGKVQEQNVLDLVSKLAVDLGIVKFPVAVIAAGLNFVADHGCDPATADGWIANYGDRPKVKFAHGSGVGPFPSEGGDVVEVVVQASRNVGSSKRQMIDEAKLKWHGKGGYWHGHVTKAVAQWLEDTFAGKVTIHPVSENNKEVVATGTQIVSDGGGMEANVAPVETDDGTYNATEVLGGGHMGTANGDNAADDFPAEETTVS